MNPRPILYYIPANATDGAIPPGTTSNTFRLGDKWFNQLEVGKVVDLRETGTERSLGSAAVVDVELMSLTEALNRRAQNNHVGLGLPKSVAQSTVLNAIKAAYGDDLKADSFISVITLVPLLDE